MNKLHLCRKEHTPNRYVFFSLLDLFFTVLGQEYCCTSDGEEYNKNSWRKDTVGFALSSSLAKCPDVNYLLVRNSVRCHITLCGDLFDT